ncbi:MAG: hypothetical protein KF708_09785 [Pirellulales bacterium]|nr:hypothetical protein [Pirellulales bacterium]
MREHILAVLGGAMAGVLGVAIVEALSSLVYPLPVGLDTNDREAMKAHLAGLPPGAFLLVLAAHATGSFVGGAVSALIARRRAYDKALIVGLLLMVAGILTLVSLPHPIWFALADVALYVPFAFLGCSVAGSLVERRSETS